MGSPYSRKPPYVYIYIYIWNIPRGMWLYGNSLPTVPRIRNCSSENPPNKNINFYASQLEFPMKQLQKLTIQKNSIYGGFLKWG